MKNVIDPQVIFPLITVARGLDDLKYFEGQLVMQKDVDMGAKIPEIAKKLMLLHTKYRQKIYRKNTNFVKAENMV